MTFKIKGKVALITGGASGIGFSTAKELLRHGLRGVTLADVNQTLEQQALKELEKEFGPNKAIFVQTDVTNKQSFKDAFKKTIETFKNLDILINNAGVLNDALWEKEILVNINGVVHGILLGLENFIPKFKTDEEGVIVNVSSIAGIKEFPTLPIYTATKHAVVAISKSFGNEVHYKRSKIKILVVCPGGTHTPLISQMSGRNLSPVYESIPVEKLPIQKSEQVATAILKIIKNANTGTVWVAEGGKDPYEFIIPPRENFAS